jgi:hypothetical protein
LGVGQSVNNSSAYNKQIVMKFHTGLWTQTGILGRIRQRKIDMIFGT